MRLTRVHVTEFKSVQDSTEFEVGDITCLVGKNEAGKTALLQALYKLNPVVAEHSKFDVTDEYPRAYVEDYRQEVEQKKRNHARAVRAYFSLDQSEMQAVEKEFGSGSLNDAPQLELSKGYNNTLYFTVNHNEAQIVRNFISGVDLTEEARIEAEKLTSIQTLHTLLGNEARRQEKAAAAATAEANAVSDPEEKAQALLKAAQLAEKESTKVLRNKLTPYVDKGLHTYIYETHLQSHVPKFLYFDEFYQMEGQVNIDSLKARQASNQLLDSDRPMLGLIDLARINLDQLINAQNTQEMVSRIEGAGNYLSRRVLDYWSQNRHIQLRFDLRPGRPGDPVGFQGGTNLWANVYDSAHWVTVRVGTRSRGFIWFFSFLAWFAQQQKSGQPIILLLDEPGVFLHASAQGDLLRYIEKELKGQHQVIYTTHSPFMIDPRHFERVRIVRDRSMEEDRTLNRDQEGTKVFSDPLEADPGSLFPLQGALAYDITQTLFIGPNSLLIEGVSDLLYLPTLSELLQDKGKIGLDSRWTLTPVGGIDKAPTFVALFQAQESLKVATLLDLQKKDQQKIENLYKQKLLQQSQVRTFADFTKTKEADIEDMFAPDFYLELVNGAYAAELLKPITPADLTSKHPRILVRLEEYLNQNPLKSGSFNHYRPARYFAEHIGILASKLDQPTLDRFESAFKTLNALL